ncbi:polyhydroxyalkanoate synthesis repressor PhaR [Abyssibius alkaniclasticus]|uniref:polyhydroxyalkanoate synthesis repressor PhaR n=1 Tax=Abyssibius alkaniclasticus TaxID=2881234 RepID=UPI00236427F6|nr:polyhydroxyalkanoate synthesis repressor PhaR [Abyssibius alkaniclasticus]UPH71362.1 polyhydroxyalkanoate synthesis repressor PhaR [Abyssibius alkaniclasticus]
MAEPTQSDEPIVIKKYANRRLYNTAKSSYVTLENLSQMVRDGEDFVVHDAKSGEDITRSVLAQIIFEAESKGNTMLPTNFLRQLIALYGDSLQGVVPGYLDASMETFTKNQEAMRAQISSAFGANPAIANLESLARTNMEWFENAMRMFSPFPGAVGGKESAGEKPAEAPKKPRESELDALKSQLSEMQVQLSKLVGKP